MKDWQSIIMLMYHSKHLNFTLFNHVNRSWFIKVTRSWFIEVAVFIHMSKYLQDDDFVAAKKNLLKSYRLLLLCKYYLLHVMHVLLTSHIQEPPPAVTLL